MEKKRSISISRYCHYILRTIKLYALASYALYVSYWGMTNWGMTNWGMTNWGMAKMKESYPRYYRFLFILCRIPISFFFLQKGKFCRFQLSRYKIPVRSKCVIVDYNQYRPVSPSLNGMVAFAWLCEKMKVDIKIESPTRMIWRHFENSTIINTTGDEKREFESSKQRFFHNHIAFIGRFFISSEYGYKVLSKLSIKESIRQSADEWFDKHIEGDWVAVHYRGTDTEATKESQCKNRYKMELDNYIIYLKTVLDSHLTIFACSDQQQFIAKMCEAFPGRVYARDIRRSYDRRPIHLHFVNLRDENFDNFEQEKDAFIDLLILAKAKLIYTTSSGFVDVARYFNPKTRIISMDDRSIGRGKNNVPIPRKDLYDKLRIH